ncbi:hypothetical protein EDB86DRAFT_2830886 [Lactarius hatsudake]|nr:hypothetical protein EDB86DRAFT_2830886 [Lactarius hatsudake]
MTLDRIGNAPVTKGQCATQQSIRSHTFHEQSDKLVSSASGARCQAHGADGVLDLGSWVRSLLLSRLTPGLCASAPRHNSNHVISERIGIRSLVESQPHYSTVQVSRPLVTTPAHEGIEQLQSNPSREFPKIASTATNHTHRKFDGGMERCPGAQSTAGWYTAMAPRELDEVLEPGVSPELCGDSTPFNHNDLPEAGTASE